MTRPLGLLTALTATVSLACSSASESAAELSNSDSPRSTTNTSRPAEGSSDGPLVSVSLGMAGKIFLLDLALGRASQVNLHPLKPNPGSAAVLGDQSLAVGMIADGTVRILNVRNGKEVSRHSLDADGGGQGGFGVPKTSVTDLLWAKGNLYATGYHRSRREGSFYRLNPETLTVSKKIPIGAGPLQAVRGAKGYVWTANEDFTPSADGTSVSRIELRRMRVRTFPLPGVPSGLAYGPKGRVWVTLYDRNMIIGLDSRGRIVGRIRGVGPGIWGLDIGPSGVGVAAAEGAPGVPGEVYVINFNDGRVIKTVTSGDECAQPREVLIASGRAVITCMQLPGVALFDLGTRSFYETIPLPDDGGGDSWPQGLSLIHRT